MEKNSLIVNYIIFHAIIFIKMETFRGKIRSEELRT